MMKVFLCTTLVSVLTLVSSALVGDNRYGAPYSSNALNGYNSHSRGPAHYSAPRAPGAPRAPSGPSRPAVPSRPAAPAYSAPRHYGSAPSRYSAPAPSHYSAPAPFNGHSSYGAPSHGPSHYSSPKRSVYQAPQPSGHASAARFGGNSNSYPQQHSSYETHAESKSQTSGREMKYTINDPHNRGTTHVTETHVVSNRQMHGAEAEAAMKKLMGSMGPSYGNDGGFQDFVKGMGLPFY